MKKFVVFVICGIIAAALSSCAGILVSEEVLDTTENSEAVEFSENPAENFEVLEEEWEIDEQLYEESPQITETTPPETKRVKPPEDVEHVTADELGFKKIELSEADFDFGCFKPETVVIDGEEISVQEPYVYFYQDGRAFMYVAVIG